jgi:hypothetical protein
MKRRRSTMRLFRSMSSASVRLSISIGIVSSRLT